MNKPNVALFWSFVLLPILLAGCASIKKELVEEHKETYENGVVKSITHKYKLTRGRETSESYHDYLTVIEYYTVDGKLVRKEECRSESTRIKGLKGPPGF